MYYYARNYNSNALDIDSDTNDTHVPPHSNCKMQAYHYITFIPTYMLHAYYAIDKLFNY